MPENASNIIQLPSRPKIKKYAIAAFVKDNPFAVDCWDADTEEEMARIVGNCANTMAGISYVSIEINPESGK